MREYDIQRHSVLFFLATIIALYCIFSIRLIPTTNTIKNLRLFHYIHRGNNDTNSFGLSSEHLET